MSVKTEIDARTNTLRTRLTNINNALVRKGGNSVDSFADVPSEIDSLETAAEPVLQEVTVTPTGSEFSKTPDSGYNGFSKVTVAGDSNLKADNIKKGVSIYGVAGSHECDEPVLQELNVTPNGSDQTHTPGSGYDGYSKVVVVGDSNLTEGNIKKGVSIYGKTGTYEGSSAEPNLQYLEVTPARAAHIYEPDEGYDGFSEVKVTGDGDLLPENIVSGVTIFGVEGTASGGETAKTVSIDYSEYSSGTFVETLDTGEDLTYTLTLDSEGKPTSIATPDGDTVAVEW